MAVFQHDIGLQPSLLVTALSGIGLRVELAFSSELGSVPPPLFSENIYDSYYFILRCLMDSLVASPGSGVFFVERFRIINSTTLIDTGYSNFLFLVQILTSCDS